MGRNGHRTHHPIQTKRHSANHSGPRRLLLCYSCCSVNCTIPHCSDLSRTCLKHYGLLQNSCQVRVRLSPAQMFSAQMTPEPRPLTWPQLDREAAAELQSQSSLSGVYFWLLSPFQSRYGNQKTEGQKTLSPCAQMTSGLQSTQSPEKKWLQLSISLTLFRAKCHQEGHLSCLSFG